MFFMIKFVVMINFFKVIYFIQPIIIFRAKLINTKMAKNLIFKGCIQVECSYFMTIAVIDNLMKMEYDVYKFNFVICQT